MDYTMFSYVFVFDVTDWEIRYNTLLVIFSEVNHNNQSVIFGSATVGNETEESYIQLLKTFVDAMQGKLSVSVVLDGDLTMRNAIRRESSNAHH